MLINRKSSGNYFVINQVIFKTKEVKFVYTSKKYRQGDNECSLD